MAETLSSSLPAVCAVKFLYGCHRHQFNWWLMVVIEETSPVVSCEFLPWSSLSSAWLVASGGLGKNSRTFQGRSCSPPPPTKEQASGEEKICMPLCKDVTQKSRSVDVFKSLGVRCEFLPWSSLSSAWLVANGGLGKKSLACRGRLCYPHQPPPRRGVRSDLSACVPPPFTISQVTATKSGLRSQIVWLLIESVTTGSCSNILPAWKVMKCVLRCQT